MLNFIYPPNVTNGFTFYDENNIVDAQVNVYIANFVGTANSVTTTGNFVVTITDNVAPNPASAFPANFAYTVVLNVSSNATQTAQQVSNTYTWTFVDHTNNSCTATFSIPTISIQGISGVIGNGSNASTILYNNSTFQYIYDSDSPFYQAVVVGNSVNLNVLGCQSLENTYVIVVDNISGSEEIIYGINANANGVFNYVATVNASSDPYSFTVSGFGYYDPYTPNTIAGAGFTVNSPVVLFDQTTIVTNATTFSGYAFTTVNTSYPPSIVSLYANNTFIGNAITSNTTGLWTYTPSLAAGTYAIVAAAKPQLQPYNNTFTWIYSNAITTYVESASMTPEFLSVSFGSPYVYYANNNAGDTYDSNLTAIFSGFAANASIQVTNTEFTNSEDFYDVQTTYSSPNTIVTIQRIFDDYYANSSNLSLPSVWTFTDVNNVGSNVATATFALPMTTVTGNTIYQSYNINDLNDYRIYNYCNYFMLGNSCQINLNGVSPYETFTFTGGFANGTYRAITYATLGSVTALANGFVTYDLSVTENSNAFYVAVSSNTINYTYGGFIFDQTEITSANSSSISGYAWTPYDYQYSNTAILSNVSVYANSTLLGNTTTNVYGQWSLPISLSNGTYAITAKAILSNASQFGSFSIPYSNAFSEVIVNTTTIAPNIAITYPSNGASTYNTLIEGTTNVIGTVHLYNGNVAIANVSSANYTWSATPSLPYGTYTITAEIANTSGIAYANVSFDYLQPINIRLQWDTGASITDNVSSQSTIIGTVIPNTTVSVYNAFTGNFLANIASDGNGNIIFDYDYQVGDVSLTFQQVVGNTVYTQPFSFYFNNQYGTYEFLQAFFNLLPEGPAWPKFAGTNMYTALQALMRVYRRVSGRVTDLHSEAFVPTTQELLPEWNTTLGIVPDDNQSLASQQANATAKFIELGGQSVPYFENVANSFGYTVTIQEKTCFRAGTNSSIDLVPAPNYVFYWDVVANTTANGSTMQATIDEYAPAHTVVHWKFD